MDNTYAPFTVRVDKEVKDAFRELCRQEGITLNQGLGRMMKKTLRGTLPEAAPESGPDPEAVIRERLAPYRAMMKAGLLPTNAYNTRERDHFHLSAVKDAPGARRLEIPGPPGFPDITAAFPVQGSMTFLSGDAEAFFEITGEETLRYTRTGSRRAYFTEKAGAASPMSKMEFLGALDRRLGALREACRDYFGRAFRELGFNILRTMRAEGLTGESAAGSPVFLSAEADGSEYGLYFAPDGQTDEEARAFGEYSYWFPGGAKEGTVQMVLRGGRALRRVFVYGQLCQEKEISESAFWKTFFRGAERLYRILGAGITSTLYEPPALPEHLRRIRTEP